MLWLIYYFKSYRNDTMITLVNITVVISLFFQFLSSLYLNINILVPWYFKLNFLINL